MFFMKKFLSTVFCALDAQKKIKIKKRRKIIENKDFHSLIAQSSVKNQKKSPKDELLSGGVVFIWGYFSIIPLRNFTAVAMSAAGSSPHSLSIVRKPL